MTYSLEELAKLFRVSPGYMSAKLPGLYGNGFPRKLPGARVWSRPQVDAWIANNGEMPAVAPSGVLAAAGAELDRGL